MRLLIPSVILVLLISILAVFLVNLPSLVTEQDLPVFPALLAGQAGFAGLMICLYGLYVLLVEPISHRSRLQRELDSVTATPWLEKSQWADKRMTHTKAGKVLFVWLFVANWWGAIWLFATDRGAQVLEQPLPVKVLCVVIFLVGVVMVWSAIRNTVNWAKFGTTTLLIETLPGRPGHAFRADMEIGFEPTAKTPVKLQLTGYVRHWTQRIDAEGNHRIHDTHDEAPFHQSEKRVKTADIKAAGHRYRVPVRLDIPAGTRPSGACGDDCEVIWKLAMQTSSPGGSRFDADFEIPVFETAIT